MKAGMTILVQVWGGEIALIRYEYEEGSLLPTLMTSSLAHL